MNGWAADQERGSRFMLQVMLWIARHLGWHASLLLLYPVSFYFYATGRRTRLASRDYLRHLQGRRVRETEVMRHIFTFACVILDRVYFLIGRDRAYRVEIEGLDDLDATLALGRGCILLGSHLGSFEVLRALGRRAPVRVKPVMYRDKPGPLSDLLENLDPAIAASIIEIGRPDAMLRVQESLQAGEMVGFLADRAPSGERTVTIDFLGAKARFPTGPLIIAAVTAAPVMLFYGLRTGPRHYTLRFEPFAERIELPRARREQDLTGWVERYAASLAERCRAAPFNWFNFYPFWDEEPAGRDGQADARAGAQGLGEVR